MVASFVRDWRDWSFACAWWNLRFVLGLRLLPGDEKHVTVGPVED